MLQLVRLTAGLVKIFLNILMLSVIHVHTFFLCTFLSFSPVCYDSGLWYRCHTGCITHYVL
jgi:hypothetical protein